MCAKASFVLMGFLLAQSNIFEEGMTKDVNSKES